MNARKSLAHLASDRTRARDELLEAALARPGVREFMNVYQDWREKDKGLDPHRNAMRTSVRTVATNSSHLR